MSSINDLLTAALLGVVQGITEYLPISSTAHLQALQLAGFNLGNSALFDASVHMGTLLAILIYFSARLWNMAKAWVGSPLSIHHPQVSEVYQLALATLPAAIFGLLAKDFLEANLSNPLLIAINSIIFGVLLGAAAFWGKESTSKISYTFAILIGLAQVLALFPGVSRSGICLTAALMLGLKRDRAAAFVFLMAIPVTLGAILLIGFDKLTLLANDWPIYSVGFLTAFIFSLSTVTLFMRYLPKIGLIPYMVYRILFGIVILIWLAFVGM